MNTHFKCKMVYFTYPRSFNTCTGFFRGRPFGGVGILVRKSIRPMASFKYYDDPRLVGLELCSSSSTEKYLFLNVYLPY